MFAVFGWVGTYMYLMYVVVAGGLTASEKNRWVLDPEPDPIPPSLNTTFDKCLITT